MSSRTRATDVLSRDEIRQFAERSDFAGWWAVGSTWAVIAACFAVLARWPQPLTWLAVVLVLGGRQLALAILSHEAAHRTLFRRTVLNDRIGNWLCAYPVWNDVLRYREHHLGHHARTGTEADPDTSLVAPFPTTRKSLVRKLLRDASGLSGLRRIVGQLLMDIGVLKYTVAASVTPRPRDGRSWRDYAAEGWRNMRGMLLVNALLATALALTGGLWLYAAWVLAYLTTFSLYLRIRSIAEHACTAPGSDILRNTRTTDAGWLARMTVAPFNVNFHIEHHLLASVPWFRLPALHRLLRERGAVEPAPGYVAVLRMASARG